MLLIVIPGSLKIGLSLIGLLAFLLLLLILYLLILRPALVLRAGLESPPPSEGYTEEVLIDGSRGERRIAIGLLDSDIKLRLVGIKEDHAIIGIEKERDIEDYVITITPGGPTFYRQPHAKKFEMIRNAEIFDSRELIGESALIRVAAVVKDNRALQFVEFELSTDYFINRFGEEKMRFFVILKKIHPGLDLNSRNKQGLYMFKRPGTEQSEEREDEES